MDSALNISITSDSKSFFHLEKEWNELLDNSYSNTIFLRWEWLYYWWLAYQSKKKRLYIIEVRENHQLLGIAPLYIGEKNFFFNEIYFLGSNIVCSDYLDFILLNNREEETLSVILDHFKKNSRLWDVLHLTDIPSESRSFPVLESFFQENITMVNRQYTVCPFIKLAQDWNTVFSSYDTIIKNTIKRKEKKFKKIAQAKYEENTSNSDLMRVYPQFIELNKARLKEKKIISPFLERKFFLFHKTIIEKLSKKNMVKLCFLKLDQIYIAGFYLLVYNNTYYYYQSGFSSVWHKLSPGTLLFHYCIKTAHARGISKFDFLQGDENYKSKWTKQKRVNFEIKIYNNTVKGKLGASIDACKLSIKKTAKRVFRVTANR